MLLNGKQGKGVDLLTPFFLLSNLRNVYFRTPKQYILWSQIKRKVDTSAFMRS